MNAKLTRATLDTISKESILVRLRCVQRIVEWCWRLQRCTHEVWLGMVYTWTNSFSWASISWLAWGPNCAVIEQSRFIFSANYGFVIKHAEFFLLSNNLDCLIEHCSFGKNRSQVDLFTHHLYVSSLFNNKWS